MLKIKKNIIKIIGNKQYKQLIVFFSRMINNYHKKISICSNKEEHAIIKIKNTNVYFGYYDYPSEKNGKTLFISVRNKKSKYANIYYYELEKNKKTYICNTNAWNFQMGSRLRWIDENEIIFNDYEKEKGYISRRLNIITKEEKKYIFPIYDISRDKEYSFYTNFTILDKNRPEYGYDNVKDDIENNNGIYRGKFKDNSKSCIISIDKIVSYNNNEICEKNYINHISCNPYDDTVIFFHLWQDKNEKTRNRVFIIDYNGNIKNILSDFDRASHYAWKNKKELLLTIIENGKEEYRLYNIESGKYKLLNFLNKDGHPSYINETKFITDTYPDHNGMQHIFLCDENKIICEIAQIYHNPRKIDQYRCDLHPRYNEKFLTFDSVINKYRTQNIIKIDLENLEEKETKDLYPYKNYKKTTYRFLSHSIEINSIKYMYTKIFNFSYRAHILINNMFKTKSRIKKEIYFNKLQKKYSMWISPKCKIGKNIHFMHLDGVTIGSGVEIGNNCTIYQQVTIGKEKEQFPTIGDNVTIYAGAKVLGGIKIGNNAVIGANAVVLKDVPDNCVAVGIPARIIKKD